MTKAGPEARNGDFLPDMDGFGSQTKMVGFQRLVLKDADGFGVFVKRAVLQRPKGQPLVRQPEYETRRIMRE